MFFRLKLFAVLLALFGLCSRSVQANDAPDQQFLRIVRDDAKVPQSLQTAIVSYSKEDQPGSKTTVDLIGAVHVGEKEYYRQLNRAFQEYDAVLYELVAPENTVPTSGQRSGHPVSMLQVSMKNLLGLEFQLDSIDYKRENFVHADLSPEEFAKSMERRGESFTKLMFRMMGQGLAQQSGDPGRTNDFAMLSAFFSKSRSQDLKRVLAQQFEELEKANAVLDGPEGSTIITERNQRAAKVLQDQLRAGKRRVAIFYGAAHLPDFDKRLRTEFKLEPVSDRWLEAWNLRTDATPTTKSKSKSTKK
jgi:hypothetical protein